MNCDQTLAALAAGNAFRRLRARRHAARCPRCRETLAFHDEVAATLAVHPPLTAEQRAVWMSVAATSAQSSHRPVSRRSTTRNLAWAAVLATAATVLAFVFVPDSAPPVRKRPVVDAPHQRLPLAQPLVPDPALRLNAMRAELDEIERELALLAQKADLLDSRAEAEVLWTQFAPVDESRTL